MSENMTYVPSRLTSAKTNKVVAGANEILDDDINLKQDVINTLSKKVIDLNSVPTSSTLTYTINSVICDFKVGDEVRVADQNSDTGYTFYKLYKLTTEEGVTTATWDKLGAGGGSANPNETVNISLTQIGGSPDILIGASIIITDDDTGDTLLTAIWGGNNILASIHNGTKYTIQATFESQISAQSNTAIGGNIRNVELQFSSIGVFIEAIDGTLYTASNWALSGKIANSIVVKTNNTAFRLALEEQRRHIAGDNYYLLSNYMTPISDESLAKADYNGKSNTEKIIQFENYYGFTDPSSYAGYYCNSYTFPNGTKAYMPSMGQVNTMRLNIENINACLTACGGTTLSGWYWTSTFFGTTDYGTNHYEFCWNMDIVNGTTNNSNNYIRDTNKVRPCANYE